MKWYKKQLLWMILSVTLLLLILFVLLYMCEFPVIRIIKSELFWTIIGILLATFISFYTHNTILKRDKKVMTIQTLSSIRAKYPDLSCVKTAKCDDNDKLNDLRTAYLKEMEFFSIGVFEGVFDIEIIAKMSSHLLIKQYDEYMNKTILENKKHEWAYTEYPRLIQELRNVTVKDE